MIFFSHRLQANILRITMLSSVLVFPLAHATTIANSEITSTHEQANKITTSVIGNAQDWNLSGTEWQDYQNLMSGPAGKWYPQLTPAEVLGMFADNTKDQQHFAEIAAKEQHEKITREIAFNNAFHQAMHTLYADEPVIKPFDMSAFNPMQSTTKKSMLGALFSHGTTSLQSGDHLAFFVDTKALVDFQDLPTLSSLVKSHSGLVLDIYCVGTASDFDIQSWAKLNNLPVDLVSKGLITLNHDDGKRKSSLSSGALPQILLIREGKSQSVNLANLH